MPERAPLAGDDGGDDSFPCEEQDHPAVRLGNGWSTKVKQEFRESALSAAPGASSSSAGAPSGQIEQPWTGLLGVHQHRAGEGDTTSVPNTQTNTCVVES